MSTDFVMPKLEDYNSAATIHEWLVENGQYVERGELLLVVESEKVTIDVESPHSGYLEILTPVGKSVFSGAKIATFSDIPPVSVSAGAPATEQASQAEIFDDSGTRLEVRVPQLSDTMTSGTINDWLVVDGHRVEEGKPLFVVESEKVIYDIDAPASGYLRLLHPVGATVDCGTVIAYIFQ